MNPLNKMDGTELPEVDHHVHHRRQSMTREEDRRARSGKLQNIHETRDEALERGAQRNLAADEETWGDFLAYNIENRIASDPQFPFILITIIFIINFLAFGIMWYQVGVANEANGGSNDDVYGTASMRDAFFFAISMLTTGGSDEVPDEFDGVFRLLFIAMILIGPTIIFAILVGFINDAVSGYMDSLEAGETKVLEDNHTLILGWNEATPRVVVQTAFLRRQYQQLNESVRPELYYLPLLRLIYEPLGMLERPSSSMAANDIVILTNTMTKQEMHTKLQQTFDERGINPGRTKIGQNVICRVGDPTNVNDLIRCGVHRAAAVLVQMTREDEEEEDNSHGKIRNGSTLRVGLAARNTVVAHLHDGLLNPELRIVLQMSSPSEFAEALCFENHLHNQVIIPMDLSLFLNSLLFKAVGQPGLAKVLLMIFDFEGMSVRRRKAKNLRGGPNKEYGHCCGLGSDKRAKTWAEFQRQYDTAVFIGLVRPSLQSMEQLRENNLGLCPDPTIVIEPEDLLIFIGPKSTPVRKVDTEAKFDQYAKEATEHHESFRRLSLSSDTLKTNKNILICGWRPVWAENPVRLYKRIHQVSKLCLPGSCITFLNFVETESFATLMGQMGVLPVSNDPSPQFAASTIPAEVKVFKMPEEQVRTAVGLVQVSVSKHNRFFVLTIILYS